LKHQNNCKYSKTREEKTTWAAAEVEGVEVDPETQKRPLETREI